MDGKITNLFQFPVKGLSGQSLQKVSLRQGEGFPCDREFGLARADSGFDPDAPRPLPKNRFLMLMKDEQLARLDTFLDPETSRLTVHADGQLLLDSDISTDAGAESTAAFFSEMFGFGDNERPFLAHAAPHRFTDVSVVSQELMNAVSLINLASVKDLETRIGATVDPMRFRGNIYFDGWPAFSELELVDREVAIGDARLKILKRTRRCPATEVNPATAERDIAVPQLLQDHYGHADMGVYAIVVSPGDIRPGDTVQA